MAVFMFGENDPLHFGTLHKSMLSLFRVVTLEDWTDIMYVNMYGCDHSIWGYSFEEGCKTPSAHRYLSPFFFVSFVLIGTMIVLNLFIGVIMNSMDEVREEEEQKRVDLKVDKNEALTRTEELQSIMNKMDALKIEMNVLMEKLKK
jgi:voltage-gated sodium channel